MKVVVGLGNPGTKYEETRHNAGFILIDRLAAEHGIQLSQEKYQAVLGKGRLLGCDCLLVKPQTFMNLSGKTVGPLVRFFKIAPSDLVVLHDEVDVLPGKVRARVGGGPGGHNGIKSIHSETGWKDFHRIKIGVGRPSYSSERGVSDWVLGRFSVEELTALQQDVYPQVVERLKSVLERE